MVAPALAAAPPPTTPPPAPEPCCACSVLTKPPRTIARVSEDALQTDVNLKLISIGPSSFVSGPAIVIYYAHRLNSGTSCRTHPSGCNVKTVNPDRLARPKRLRASTSSILASQAVDVINDRAMNPTASALEGS